MTYQIETNGKKLLLVEVNENSSEFEIIHNDNDVNSKNLPILIYLRGSGAASQNLFEYGKQFSILGTITDNKDIDFDCEMLVEFEYSTEIGSGRKWYRDYQYGEPSFLFKKSTDSFLSLLESKQIQSKKLVCLEIKK